MIPSLRSLRLLSLALPLAAATPTLAPAAENMLGRQSQNEGIFVLPAPGPVKIDGDLADWDLSGRIWSFADQAIRNRYSAETAAMWDADALYLGIKWRDPTPMHSTVDPAFNPESGWKSDSVQMRVRSADQTSWFTTWHFAPSQQPVFHVAVWKDVNNSRAGQDTRLYVAPEGGTVLGDGLEMAYREDADGAGYVQEIRIPWSFIFRQPPTIQAGLGFRLGLEFLWGDPTGQTWPVHRYADNLQPGQTSREFFWTAHKAWGDATLVAAGNLTPRRYVSDTRRVEGSFPIRLDLPKSAARFTLAIDDQAGNRVRNLAGDLLPEDYTVAETAALRTVEVGWDGLDDQGKLVPPGSYQVRGLHHAGLGAEYEMCFYNPGTPPWPVANGSGAWGADHCPPLRAARSGDWMILSWAFAEGGDGIVGIGPDGHKRWGEKRGATLLAADPEFVYGVPAGWHIKRDVLIRLDKTTGAYRPFVADGQERPFELPFADFLGSDDYSPAAIVASESELIILLHPKRQGDEHEVAGKIRGETDAEGIDAPLPKAWLARLEKRSAKLLELVPVKRLATLALGQDGKLYGGDGKTVFAIDPKTGALTPLPTPGLHTAGPLAVDNQGNILVMDVGPDYQVKAYSPAGERRYTCGKQGGRPLRGDFEPQAMQKVSSLAVDATNLVWAVESWDYPRRVGVWQPADGSLVRDYIGNTGYAGTGCYLHDSDPTLAYVGPVELKLDQASRSWQVTRVLWVPDPAAGERFAIGTGEHAHPQRFTATVNGRPHEYLFAPPYREYSGYKIFLETETGWRPVAAITTVGQISGQVNNRGEVIAEPDGEFAGLHAFDAVFWNDANGDGKVQRDECQIIQPDKPRDRRNARAIPIPMGSGWGARIATDFVVHVNGLACYRPLRFTAEGAPVYGPESLERLPVDERGDLIPVPEEELLLCLSFKGYAGPTRLAGLDSRTGATRWQYPNPYPGVHGSHRAPMPGPGMIVGPLKIAGVALVDDQVGRVFLMRGNLGQDFLVTTDGLFVGAMFQDGRLPNEALPNQEDSLIGVPMEHFSHGGEPFNGWFGRHADGKIRMTTGFPRQAAMILAVNGLESIRRFEATPLNLGADQLAAADLDNQTRAVQEAPPKVYTIQSFETAPRIDGRGNDWEGIPELVIDRPGFPFKGTARLAVDAENLYLLFTIQDESPWRNEGKDYTRLFKTGDAVDLQLCVDPGLTDQDKRRDPGPADLRLLLSQLDGQPAAVLMKPVDPTAPAELAVDYTSPVAPRHFARVELLKNANLKVTVEERGYTVEAAIPLATLGLTPATGLRLRGDLGFISSDAAGTVNIARTYWANKDTNLVNDLPQEAWLYPATWGTLVFP